MKKIITLLFICFSIFAFCACKTKKDEKTDLFEVKAIDPAKIEIKKDLLYDQHTLADTFSYKDTFRVFQWDKIRTRIAMLEALEQNDASWAILQNYKNMNGRAPLTKKHRKDEYNRNTDTLGIEQHQGIPLYSTNDTITPERYGRDGGLVRYVKDTNAFVKIVTPFFPGEWFVPKKYVKQISDTVNFSKIIFIDRENQNIVSLEKTASLKWSVRSMNPATTGLHRPPYQQETPLGIFVVQAKKPKMPFLKDGTDEMGGFAPHASRFTNGGYIHGVPVNLPSTKIVEYSSTLGTTPRSHMCVRNATSHAKFIYDWAVQENSLVFVIE